MRLPASIPSCRASSRWLRPGVRPTRTSNLRCRGLSPRSASAVTKSWDRGVDGVLTNVLAVGFTRTSRNQDRFPRELFDRAGSLTPQRRTSTADDVARAVLWLGSDANTSITGAVIREGTSAARTPLVALG